MSPYIPEEEGRGEGEEKSALSLRRSVRISLSSPLALSCVSTKNSYTHASHSNRSYYTHTPHTLFCNGRNRLTVRKGWKKATRRANQRRLWQIIGKDSLSLSLSHTFHRCLADCITFSQRQEPPDADQLWSVLKSP